MARPLRVRLSALRRPQTLRHYATQPQPPRATPPQSKFFVATLVFSSATSLLFAAYILSRPRDHAFPSAIATLAPHRFVPTTVVRSEDAGPDTKLITLKLPVPRSAIPRPAPSQGPLDASPIWSVYIKDSDIQVERAYTPLSASALDSGSGQLTFWIKRYPNGEVGRWLHAKKPGDTVEIRGPLRTVDKSWAFRGEEWDHIVMISGGTGITPFVQLLDHLSTQLPDSPISPTPPKKTRFTLLHGSRTPADLPPPELLGPLLTLAREQPERYCVKLFVDAENQNQHQNDTPSTSASQLASTSMSMDAVPAVRRISRGDIEDALGIPRAESSWWSSLFRRSADPTHPPINVTGRKTLFLVCGPEGMISAVAGASGRNLSQGPVAGVLGEMGFGPDSVYKLL